MIRGAIFDVDGTLLDSMPIWDEAAARWLRGKGLEPEKDLGKILFPMTITEGAAYLVEHYDLSEDIPTVSQGVLATVNAFYEMEAPLKPGALELLHILHDAGIPMAVATSSERAHIEAAFRRLNILTLFRTILTCTEVGAGKSNPLIFQKAAFLLGTGPAETLVFEDGLYAIQTARNAGFRTVGLYDPASEDDWPEIRNTAEWSLKNFWKAIQNITKGVLFHENSFDDCRNRFQWGRRGSGGH